MLKNQYNPDIVSCPGQTIAELLEERSMDFIYFARQMELTNAQMMSLLFGEIELTSEMAQKLEQVFGASAKFWENSEANYREWRRKRMGIDED